MSALERARDASADVLVGDRRTGTAVLVSEGVLLTARHVVQRRGEESVRVRFPPSVEEHPVQVAEPGTPSDDVVVLTLVDHEARSRAPQPVDIWADDQLPTAVTAFGYPTAEPESIGVWRSFTRSGTTSTGVHQLNWDDGQGSLRGHSGGPVVDMDSGAFVGLLLGGAGSARLDRFVSVPEIARMWPALPRPWSFGPGARALVTRLAHGRRSGAQSGDFFRGRREALRATSDWLSRGDPGAPLVITGQPGSGKSAVLGRAALEAEHGGGRGIFFLARQQTAQDLLEAVAAMLDLSTPSTMDHLIDEVVSTSAGVRVTLVVDGLDEASTVADAQQMAETLSALSGTETFRVVVATRPLASGDRFQAGGLLNRLMAQHAASPNLIDLDAAPYVDADALVEFADAMLSQEGTESPAPAGAAWESYRLDAELRLRLARAIADRAQPNFLVAGIAAMTLSQDDRVIDPADPEFDSHSIPANVAEALEKYFQVMRDEQMRRTAKNLLASLAYALGPGVSDDRWLRFTAALGYDASRSDIDAFRDSPGADYLIQTTDAAGAHSVRLFHRALVEQLRRGRQESDWLKIFTDLRADVQAVGGWARADHYATTYAAEHASACNRVSALLKDLDYLRFADMGALVSTLRAAAPDEHVDLATVVTQEGPRLQRLDPRARLWLLATSALHGGLLDVRDQMLAGATWLLEPVWAHPLGSTYQKLTGEIGPVTALAIGRLGTGHVVAAGGRDGTVHVWNPRRGDLFGALDGHQAEITSIGFGTLDGDDVMLSGAADGTVSVWSRRGEPLGDPVDPHERRVHSVFTTTYAGQSAVVSVAGGDTLTVRNPEGHVLQRFQFPQRQVAVEVARGDVNIVGVDDKWLSRYSLTKGYQQALRVTPGRKTALAMGRMGQVEVVAGALGDGSVALWRLPDGGPHRAPLPPAPQRVRGLAVHRIDATDVVLVLRSDDSLSVWNPWVGLSDVWRGHPGTASVAAVGSLGGGEVVACAGNDGVVRLWEGRTLLNQSRSSSREPIHGLAVSAGSDGPVAATLARTRIALWQADGTPASVQPPFDGTHIVAFALGDLGEGPVLAWAGTDRRLRLWNLRAESLLAVNSGHERKVRSLAFGDAEWPVIVTRSDDGTARVLDQNGLEQAIIPLPPDAQSARPCVLGGRRSLIVAVNGASSRIWDCDLETWSHQLPVLGGISAVLVTKLALDGRDVLAFGCSDGHIRTWAPGQGAYRVSVTRHDGRISGIVSMVVGGSPVLVTTGSDGTIRVWQDMAQCERFVLSEPPSFLASSADEVFLSSGPALMRITVRTTTPLPVRTGSARLEFSSCVPLPFSLATLSAHGTISRPQYGVGRTEKLARATADAGLFAEAVAALIPHAAQRSALDLAAELALRSHDPEVITHVLPHLVAAAHAPVSTQARLLALALFSGRLDLAARTSTALLASPHDARVQLVGMLNAASADDEWLVYTHATALDQGELAVLLADVCAARILAISRRTAQVRAAEFERIRRLRLADYWEHFTFDDRRTRLAAMLTDYATAGSSGFFLLPYQVISVYETLAARDAETAEGLRPQTVQRIASALRLMAPRHRDSFAAWAELSDIAAEAWQLRPV
jgi:WD40 repeat protein